MPDTVILQSLPGGYRLEADGPLMVDLRRSDSLLKGFVVGQPDGAWYVRTDQKAYAVKDREAAIRDLTRYAARLAEV